MAEITITITDEDAQTVYNAITRTEDGTNETAKAKIAEYIKNLTVNYITSKAEETESAKLKKAQEDCQLAIQLAEDSASNIVIT